MSNVDEREEFLLAAGNADTQKFILEIMSFLRGRIKISKNKEKVAFELLGKKIAFSAFFLVEKLEKTHGVVLYKPSKNCLIFSIISFNFHKANQIYCNALQVIKKSRINRWSLDALIKREFKN